MRAGRPSKKYIDSITSAIIIEPNRRVTSRAPTTSTGIFDEVDIHLMIGGDYEAHSLPVKELVIDDRVIKNPIYICNKNAKEQTLCINPLAGFYLKNLFNIKKNTVFGNLVFIEKKHIDGKIYK